MVNDRDKIVQELFNVVQIKKIEIAKAENQIGKLIVYLDNKDSSVNTNLQVCNNVEDLVNILGFLIERKIV
jgi:nitrate reductase NapAB chaperone NapD